MTAAVERSGPAAWRTATPRGAAAENPFVAISPGFKIGVLLYFVIWRIFPDLVQPFVMITSDVSSAVARSMISLCVSALILWPIMANRFGGMPTGWLHPLVLPSLINIATGFIKEPATILDPVSAITSAQMPTHALATGSTLASAWLEVEIWELISLLAIYVAFTVFQPRFDGGRHFARVFDRRRWALVYAVFFAAALTIVIGSGGLEAHMASLASGRFRAIADSGILLVPVTFMPVISVLWFLHRPQDLRNAYFLVTFSVSVLLQFVIIGSRSGLFSAAVLLFLGWIYVHRRPPVVRLLMVGVAAVVLLGALGDIRQSGRSGEVELDQVMNLDLAEAIERSQQEVEERQYVSGPIGIAVSVPERVGYLYGDTYLGGLLFFIPRSIWEDKPRGPGPAVAALIFGDRSTLEGYEGGGIPAGGAGEAYFNFGYPGIILVHLLFGLFLKWVAGRVLARRDGESVMLLLLVGAELAAPTTGTIVPFLQKWVLLAVCYRFIFRRAKR